MAFYVKSRPSRRNLVELIKATLRVRAFYTEVVSQTGYPNTRRQFHSISIRSNKNPTPFLGPSQEHQDTSNTDRSQDEIHSGETGSILTLGRLSCSC